MKLVIEHRSPTEVQRPDIEGYNLIPKKQKSAKF